MTGRFTPEGKVKAQVKKVLEQEKAKGTLYGWWPVPAGYGENSLDFVGCHYGRFFAVETKAPGQQLNANQQLVARRIEQAGGKVFIIDGTERRPLQPLVDWLVT